MKFIKTKERASDSFVLNPDVKLQKKIKARNKDYCCFLTGNEDGYFSIDKARGLVYQIKEIDLEAIPFDRFNLEVQAVQKDNPLKTALAKVKVSKAELRHTIELCC